MSENKQRRKPLEFKGLAAVCCNSINGYRVKPLRGDILVEISFQTLSKPHRGDILVKSPMEKYRPAGALYPNSFCLLPKCRHDVALQYQNP